MFKLKNILKTPAVVCNDGTTYTIQSVFLKHKGNAVCSLGLSASGKTTHLYIDVSAITAVGADAVMLNAVPTSTPPESKVSTPPLGKPVYRSDGVLMGKINDMLISKDYTVIAYLLNSNIMLPPAALTSKNHRYIISKKAADAMSVGVSSKPNCRPLGPDAVSVGVSSNPNCRPLGPDTVSVGVSSNPNCRPLGPDTGSVDSPQKSGDSTPNPSATTTKAKKKVIKEEPQPAPPILLSGSSKELLTAPKPDKLVDTDSGTTKSAPPAKTDTQAINPKIETSTPAPAVIIDTTTTTPVPSALKDSLLTVSQADTPITVPAARKDSTLTASQADTPIIVPSALKDSPSPPINTGNPAHLPTAQLVSVLNDKLTRHAPRIDNSTGKPKQSVSVYPAPNPSPITPPVTSDPSELIPPSPDETVTRLEIDLPNRIIADYSFLLGRISVTDIMAHSGEVIIPKNSLITVSTVLNAHSHNRLLELTRHSRL